MTNNTQQSTNNNQRPNDHLFIVDAHLDLAYIAANYHRDLQLSVAQIRELEGKRPLHGFATVSYPDLKAAGVGLIFPTLFVSPADNPLGNEVWKTGYHNADEAHRMGMTQFDYYHRLVDEDASVRLVGDLSSLEEVVESWQNGQTGLLGMVPLMEGADPIRHPDELEMWYARGLRVIGLAWDDTRYAAGAWRNGRYGLTKEGHQLLEAMADFGFILDLTHMSEKATLESLDRYEGPIVATHSNVRALVPGERQFCDTQIRRLGERDGVIGIVLFNQFLQKEYRKGDGKELVTLEQVVAHIDHICQLLGDATHVGIGSDFDGGFGAADIPAELDSVRDLHRLADVLKLRGYGVVDIENIMGGNWLNLLRRSFS